MSEKTFITKITKRLKLQVLMMGVASYLKKKNIIFFVFAFSLIFFTLMKKLNIFIYSLILIWFLNSIIIF